MNTMRLPLKFKKDSFEVEVIVENSDEYFAILIGNTIQIEPNSLPISTFYGVKDSVFDSRQTTQVSVQVGNLIPEVRVVETNLVQEDSGQVNLAIKFERI